MTLFVHETNDDLSKKEYPLNFQIGLYDILKFQPCVDYSRKYIIELMKYKESITMLEVLYLDIPIEDRLWLAIRVLPNKEQCIYASNLCAELQDIHYREWHLDSNISSLVRLVQMIPYGAGIRPIRRFDDCIFRLSSYDREIALLVMINLIVSTKPAITKPFHHFEKRNWRSFGLY